MVSGGNDVLRLQYIASESVVQELANSLAQTTQPLSQRIDLQQRRHTPLPANISAKHTGPVPSKHSLNEVNTYSRKCKLFCAGRPLFCLRFTSCFLFIYLFLSDFHFPACVNTIVSFSNLCMY